MLEIIANNWMGLLGFTSGLLCVWLLIKENILTFPIGLVYAVLSVYVMYRSRLYADTLLNVYFVLMNAYGWYYWRRGGQGRRSAERLLIVSTPVREGILAAVVVLVGTVLMGSYLSIQTDADYPFPDSFTTVLSFVAMWMAARKYLANWALWLVVNVVSVGLYLLKGKDDATLYYYAGLYAIYIWLAVVGWRAWRSAMSTQPAVTV